MRISHTVGPMPKFTSARELLAHYRDVRSRTWPVQKSAPIVKPVKSAAPPRKERRWPRLDTRTDRVRRIMATVADHYKRDTADLINPIRAPAIAEPRHVAMYLTRELTDLSFKGIGRRFNRDHKAVIYAIRQVHAAIQTDPELRQTVERLVVELRGVG